jgi:pyruvate formate lyase activating enzyme
MAGALEMVGRDISVSEALGEVLEDRPFYGPSGGGLTLSGGEPLAQFDFTAALLQAAKEQGVHCCLETSGYAPWHQLETLLGLVDLFFYDYKETDPARHAQYTGVSNELILDNLRALYSHGARIALRCPIIPGSTDREDHFAGIAALAREKPKLERVELLPYHPLGGGKAERLGMAASPSAATPTPDRAAIERWIGWFAAQGVRVRCPQASAHAHDERRHGHRH